MIPAEILETELARAQTKKIDDAKNNLTNSIVHIHSNKPELVENKTIAIIEQLVAEPLCELPLLQADCAIDSYKNELCDVDSIISMPQLENELDNVASEPITCAENKHFLPIAIVQDELKLSNSLNTLGYIKFNVLCNLNYLDEKLSFSSDLPWMCRNKYHFGKYNSK